MPVQGLGYIEQENPNAPIRRVTPFVGSTSSKNVVAAGMSSRMSIERYLKAPLSDEAASAPAISAALRKQIPRNRMDSAASLHHSRETSVDVHSEGRRTFFTSGSVPDTVDTLYTIDSKSMSHRIVVPEPDAALFNTQWLPPDPPGGTSPDRPTTSGTIGPVDMAREWAERVEKFMPGYSPDKTIDYRAKAEEEISKIQEKAKELELMMIQYKNEQELQRRIAPKVTDEAAHAIMAANPKVAWILGGDAMDARSIVRPKSVLSTSEDIQERPSTAGKIHGVSVSQGRFPRRTRSNGALDARVHQAPAIALSEKAIERQPSKRVKYYCTFCQKRFHSRIEWLRHERTIHMPEELWVCCPRTGNFPTKCPFCEKGNPSPAHLADHNYLSCQEKPLSERTFGRKDHFLQHISQVHKVSPSQKPARLTELEDAWRHPLPMRTGHKALHCGFCGAIFKTYQERTMHVGRHFLEGTDMMSWWKDRVSHEVQMPEAGETAPNP